MWRIGLMGPNASIATADRVLEALTAAVESRAVAVAG
jgi:aspartate aminotransferase-like enzyme